MHPVETNPLGDPSQRPALRIAATPAVGGEPDAAPPVRGSGKLVGIWRLGEPLHTGKQWQLWAAQPADSLGSPRWDYALKMLPRSDRAVSDPQQGLSQLRCFAEVAAAVRHPNLVPVVDVAVQRSEPFLVMPRLSGRPLSALLAGAAQPLPVVLWLTRQIASAAAALHGAGFVHGAIDPAGVLVSGQGHATLIDLGATCRLGQSFTAGPDRDTAYAASETLQSDTVADAASDVFSLGRLLWQLLARVDRAHGGTRLEPVADLIAELVDPEPAARPTAEQLVERLIELETATLGQHIRPVDTAAQRQAA